MFNQLLLNFILILFPLMLYLFFVAYNKKINIQNNNLILRLALLTTFYLQLKYSNNMISEIFFMTSIISLIIAYLKKDKVSILLLSIVHILCFTFLYNFNIVFLLFEYFVIFICSMLLSNRLFTFTCFLLRILFIVFQLWNVEYYSNIFDVSKYLYILSVGIGSFFICNFVMLLLSKGENILNYHMSIKELEREKQVRNSLFKITHEIKNPIAVCKGYFDMLDMDNKEQVKKYLPIIREEIDRTLLLLQDFLSMTKIKINKDIMDINMLVEDVVNSFKPIFKHHKINYNIDLYEDEVYISGDYERLKQVLINVIKNSVEAIEMDGRIDILTKMDRQKFIIMIKDNGIGMNNEVLNNLASPFYTTKKNGTGLGVALSKEIIKEHGGQILYNSEDKKGTMVTILLNIQKNA